LSEDIQFKDLWLLVVDEEHKFWVKDKEKIKNLKGNIDILSMSATPIPRSLNMALNWIKSISMLTTPPVGRQAIHTIVSNFSDKVIEDAGKKEFERWGQLFFIHNRVETISHFGSYLEKIFPKKKIIVTHGQLPWDTLEKRIIDFKNKKYDILLSTTVIENGIDFPNVNTMIIHEAGNFWISQIHQLRGRVGRSEKQWYCYLLFKKDKIKQDAAKRLKTIVDYSHLWAGFELAIKDLEIRWWWDILGIRQSGQSVEIGVNLFLQMLESKVEELKNDSVETNKSKLNWKPYVHDTINTKIDLNISIFIDNSFFASELDKINFYREIESLNTIKDLESIILDFKETTKNIPKWTLNFFDLLRLKILATQFQIISIRKVWINYQIDFKDTGEKGLENLKQFLELDKEVKFRVISVTRLRSETKRFTNDESFLEYMLQLFGWKITNSKIKLKTKKGEK
jgi:transcription-repair coupling factor (superfamily II helicase)